MFDYTKLIPPAVAAMKPSGIRKYFGIAESIPDAISLGVGEPDFITPGHIVSAGIASLRGGKTKYTANNGLISLRREISNYYRKRFHVDYDPNDEIVCTVGASEGIDLVIRTFLTTGDEFLITEPSFVAYAPLTSICGAKPVPLKTYKKDNFKITPESLRQAITPKTKMILITFPNNPTGAVMNRDELLEIAKIIREHNIMVLSDEVYAELTYDEEPVCFASLPGMWERTITVSGFSKAFAMTGWRIGYVCAPRELLNYIAQIHQYALMCSSTPAQYAALQALQHGFSDTVVMRDTYNARRKYVYNRLVSMGFDCFEPQGAFYIFPDVSLYAKDGEEFSERLLKEQHVAVVPGIAFGETGKHHIRISYAYSMDVIAEALDRMELFVENLNK
ncbi:MAG: aminotransferase class I/II-fold pyridoxal phosphate-dependent enzyme [Clostridia bacterium]|nr:aminotransferase class I/II-fold pyridoxal phosphate-dependent enzyme [Clostridia bacterium]